MNIDEFKKALKKFWLGANLGYMNYLPISPKAKVVTGGEIDALCHAMLEEHGAELILEQDLLGEWSFNNYRVVDEHKFMMFVLRWS